MKHLLFFGIFAFFVNFSYGVINFGPRTAGYTYYRYNGNRSFADNIVVQNRAILVLECGIFNITKGKKITVEKGGQLFLSYATLTHESDAAGNSTTVNTANNWIGIEVLGDNGENQSTQFNQLPPCYTYGCIGYSDTIDYDINALPQYKQGFLAMYKSKIRYSNCGVTLGKILLNSPFADIGEGGGIFMSNECSFENNHFRHLYFASYSFQSNIARVISNNFNYDHLTNQWPTFQHMHRDIIARDNSFKYNFEYNNFSVFTLFNNFIGLELYQSYMRLNYNTFKYHMAGVVLGNYFGGSWNNIHYIQNNTFDQCQVGVDIGGVNKVRIDNNTIKLCTFKREINGGPNFMTYFNSTTFRPYTGFTPNQNGTVGVYSSTGSYNLQCYRNKFSAQLAPLSNQDGAIVTWMNGTLASSFFKNTSNRMVTGFRSIENNRGYQVQCNSFSASRFCDIFNDQITGTGITNSLMSNQGSPIKPTRNTHTRYTGSGRWDLNNENTTNYSGANRLRYYWRSGINVEDPRNVTSSTVNEISNFGSNLCGINLEIETYNPEEGCGRKNRIPSELTIYNGIKDDIDELLVGGISSEEEDDYALLLHDFDISMNGMIDHYISNHMEYGYNETDSIKIFLKAHNTFNSKVHLIQLYLSLDSFNVAEDLMDSLSAHYSGDDFIDDYVEYYSLISTYLQNHNNSWLFSHFDDFKTIVDSNGYMSSNALAVTQYIAYSDSTNDYFNEMFSYRFLPDISDSLLTDTITEEITVYPIPFSSNLSIDIENFTSNSRTFTIILKDLTGVEKFNSNLVVMANDIDTLTELTGSIATGLYILQIFEDGILIDSRLVSK